MKTDYAVADASTQWFKQGIWNASDKWKFGLEHGTDNAGSSGGEWQEIYLFYVIQLISQGTAKSQSGEQLLLLSAQVVVCDSISR